MRPLISTGDPKKSVDISRKAELYETSSGMLTITGGKLTTWRRMAKQTVDRLVEREGREAPCHTAEIPLGMEARPEDLEAPAGVGEEAVAQLAFRYGHAARAVLELAREDPKLAAPIVPGRPDLLAEAAIAARLEQARCVADVLLRRTRLGLLAAPQLRGADAVRAGRRGDRRRARLVAAAGQARGRGLAGGGRRGRHRPRRRGRKRLPPARLNSLPLMMTKAELESKHLAELHELAAEAGVERYRMLSRAELIEKLAGGRSSGAPKPKGERGGGDAGPAPAARSQPQASRRAGRARAAPGAEAGDRERQPAPRREPAAAEPAPAAPPHGAPKRKRRRRWGRRPQGRPRPRPAAAGCARPPGDRLRREPRRAARRCCARSRRSCPGPPRAPTRSPCWSTHSPEELADWKREAPKAEIVSAGQAHHAEDALAQARARAGGGEDVIVLIDSLSRFAEAFGGAEEARELFDAGLGVDRRLADRGRRGRAPCLSSAV